MVYLKSVLFGAIAAMAAAVIVVAVQTWATGRATHALVAFGSTYLVDIHVGPVLLAAAVAFIAGFVWRLRRRSA